MAAIEVFEPIKLNFPAPAVTHLVVHGLQRTVAFQVFNSSGVEIEAEHEPVDDSSFKINLNRSLAIFVMVI